MSSPLTLPDVVLPAAAPIGASALIELPPGTPEWVRFVFVFVGAVVAPFLYRAAPPVVERLLAGRRAKKKALAAAERARAAGDADLAQRLLGDGNEGNDTMARALLESAHRRLDKADALDADAAELEAISRPNVRPPEAP